MPVQNAYRAIGLVKSRGTKRLDPLGDIIAERYAVAYSDKWKALLGPEYNYALSLLRLADLAYKPAKDEWLRYQTSFNDALVRRLLPCLPKLGLPGSMKLVDRNGQLIDVGCLLDKDRPFAGQFPAIAAPFRAANDRRNRLPGSHPYSKKEGTRNRYLEPREQKGLAKQLSSAYARLAKVLAPL